MRSPALRFAIVAALIVFSIRSAQGTTYGFVDLTPSGFTATAEGVSNGQQAGYGNVLNSYAHALLWSGSAASAVDLNPAGFTQSFAYGVSGGQQIGWGSGAATGDVAHALLWSGTAASAVDLNPSGFAGTFA